VAAFSLRKDKELAKRLGTGGKGQTVAEWLALRQVATTDAASERLDALLAEIETNEDANVAKVLLRVQPQSQANNRSNVGRCDRFVNFGCSRKCTAASRAGGQIQSTSRDAGIVGRSCDCAGTTDGGQYRQALTDEDTSG